MQVNRLIALIVLMTLVFVLSAESLQAQSVGPGFSRMPNQTTIPMPSTRMRQLPDPPTHRTQVTPMPDLRVPERLTDRMQPQSSNSWTSSRWQRRGIVRLVCFVLLAVVAFGIWLVRTMVSAVGGNA